MFIGRKGKREVSPTGAIVLLVLLAGFLLFILSLPQDYRDATLDRIESVTPEILFQLTPGDVRTLTGSSSTTRYDLTNFKLDSEMSSIDAVLSTKLNLESSGFNDDKSTYSFIPEWNTNTLGISLNAFVQSYAGNGEIIILLNGAQIYSGTPVVGSALRLNLPSSGMFQGTNILEVGLTKKGFNIFSSTKLGLSDVLLRTNSVGKDLSNRFSFEIEPGEVVSGTYTSVIRRDGSSVPLNVELNGASIYSNVPITTILTIPISKELFNSGTNWLEFSIGEGVSYEILYSDLIVKSRSIEAATNEYFFRIDRSPAKRIINGRVDCLLEIIKGGGTADEVIVDLNGRVSTHSVRAGEVSFDVCSSLVYGGNTISFASDKELTLSSASLVLS